jgi:hypothetical protein
MAEARRSFISKLFARRDHELPKPKPTSGSLSAFQSVSIGCGAKSCGAAKDLDTLRFLAKRAPALPLATCSMQNQCQCRYVKHSDRRSDVRRLLDAGMSTLLFESEERRRTAGRRRTD